MNQKDVKEAPYPWQETLGFDVSDWGPDYAEVTVPILTKHGNRYGIPHGGVLASILDTAMGFAGCYTGDPENPQMAMTLNLSVNYLSVAKGNVLIATGRRTGGGAKTFFAEGRIMDNEGTLVATATGVFRYRGR